MDKQRRTEDGLSTQSFPTFGHATNTHPCLTLIPHPLGGHWELISILHPQHPSPVNPQCPPVLHYHIFDSLYPNNNTTATASPPALNPGIRGFICRAYRYPPTTPFFVGAQFLETSARQVGGMDCGVFVVRAAMHVIAGVPFTHPAARRGGSRTRSPEQDLSYGQSLAACRVEMFLSIFRFRPPSDPDAAL